MDSTDHTPPADEAPAPPGETRGDAGLADSILSAGDAVPPGTPALEFYGMPVIRHEGLYIGLPWAYHAYEEEEPVRMEAEVDGIEFRRAQTDLVWSKTKYASSDDDASSVSIAPRGASFTLLLCGGEREATDHEKSVDLRGGDDGMWC